MFQHYSLSNIFIVLSLKEAAKLLQFSTYSEKELKTGNAFDLKLSLYFVIMFYTLILLKSFLI